MTELNKTLTTIRGAALMLNIVVGAGLLALPGLVVEVAGDQAIWAWLVCAIAAMPLLLVFIIMGRRYPDAGGIAHFSRLAFGEAGYIIASLIFLGAVTFGLPAIALTGGNYITEVFGGAPSVVAAAMIIAAALCQLGSPEIAGRVSTIVASTILLALLVFSAVGLTHIEASTIGSNIAPLTAVQLDIVLMPFMMIFFAFTGWEVAAGLAEEFKDPKRDFPRAMMLSFLAAVTLYGTMALIAQAVGSTGSAEAVFIGIAKSVMGRHAGMVVSGIVALIIFANLMGAIWAVSRMLYSLSREGYFPIQLTLNAAGAPRLSITLTCIALLLVLAADAASLLDIKTMLAIAGQNFFILYGVAGLALITLSNRWRDRLIALVALGLTVILLANQGTSLAYPLCLVAIGGVVWWWQRPRQPKA